MQRVDQRWSWLAFTAERQLYLVVKGVILELNPALVDRRQNASAFSQVEKLQQEVNRLRSQSIVRVLETQIATLTEDNRAKEQSLQVLKVENETQQRALISLKHENASLRLIIIQLRQSRAGTILESLQLEPIKPEHTRNQPENTKPRQPTLACSVSITT